MSIGAQLLYFLAYYSFSCSYYKTPSTLKTLCRAVQFHVENRKNSERGTIILFTQPCGLQSVGKCDCALYTGGQLLRATERLLLIFAPAAYQGTLRDVPAKMYRPIKMDYRFDPTHITFRARQMRRYRDRGEARRGPGNHLRQWKFVSLA